MSNIWHALGWAYASDDRTKVDEIVEVWSATPVAPGAQKAVLAGARDLYYTVGLGVLDRDSWAGPDGLVLKFVDWRHPLASIETRQWTVQ